MPAIVPRENGVTMRKSGELVQWNDARGFGFIRDGGGERHFVHIKSIRRTVTRPEPGLRVTFVPDADAQGRSIATAVVLFGVETAPVHAEARDRRPRPGNPAGARFIVATLIAAMATVAAIGAGVPVWLLVGYLVMGIASIAHYWFDKAAAEADRSRVPEMRLHTLDFAGGIIGGLVAQVLLRHKTRKQSFAAATWLIAAAHIVGLGLLLAFRFGLFPPLG
jgi:uncharacterized membrane protein YsdA (DUF1294 family)/cold shock CspA family protein